MEKSRYRDDYIENVLNVTNPLDYYLIHSEKETDIKSKSKNYHLLFRRKYRNDPLVRESNKSKDVHQVDELVKLDRVRENS